MAEQQEPRPRRARRGREQAAALAELRTRRDELDADLVKRRQLEDAALERFVAAAAKVRKVHEAAEARAVDLERQASAVRDKATEDAAAGEAEQAAALFELHELGRSAEELARLTGIAVKRVRAMVRSARPTRAVPAAGAGPRAASKVSPGSSSGQVGETARG